MIQGGFKNMNADKIIQCILAAMLKLEKTVDSDLNNKLDRGGYLVGTAQTLSDNITTEIQNRIDADASVLQNANNYTDSKVSAVYKVKGSVANYASLPASGQVIGDVWNLLDTGSNYVWTASGWDKLSETVDVSGKEDKTQKGAPNGYAPLDEFAKLAAQYLNIVNDLVTGGATALLSAEQGKILQTQVNAINTILTSDNVNLDTVQELVDAIETVQLSLSTILVNDLTTGGITKALTAEMGVLLNTLKENIANKQNSLAVDGSGTKFPTVDAVNGAIGAINEAIDIINGQII